MKALSIKEPWVSMVVSGQKTIEIRTWNTSHRGKLLICASKTPHSNLSGKAVAVVDLIDCRPMTNEDEKKACCELYEGAYAWVLDNINPITPFPIKGQLGLFDVQM